MKERVELYLYSPLGLQQTDELVQSVQLLRRKLVGERLRTDVVAGDISCFQMVRTVSEAHTTSCSVGTGFLSQGQSGRGVKLTTHVHLVAKLRMSGGVPLVPYTPSWRGQGQIYIYLLKTNCVSKRQSGYGSSTDIMTILRDGWPVNLASVAGS